jgi:hypothetical protein
MYRDKNPKKKPVEVPCVPANILKNVSKITFIENYEIEYISPVMLGQIWLDKSRIAKTLL